MDKEYKLHRLNFTIDAMLLRELGERLVGAAHVALAELIKNSYDADATLVEITVHDDRIEIVDNGHGMSDLEFEQFWMRVGSPHKEQLQYSRIFKRPLTGSKGVGRLAVQFLAGKVCVLSTPIIDTSGVLIAKVDWRKARQSDELQRASAMVKTIKRRCSYPNGSEHGTRIVLRGLNHKWGAQEFKELAREIWPLQPPFVAFPKVKEPEDASSDVSDKDFKIVLKTPEAESQSQFDAQIKGILAIWHARIRGRLTTLDSGEPGVQVLVEFSDGESDVETLGLKKFEQRFLHSVEFDIRVFHLTRRQPKGISVSEARKYFDAYGGVHIYDANFRLPFYGEPETDWLRLELDHARRINVSELLPEELTAEQPPKAMNFLPTLKRVFGIVHVNTSAERRHFPWESPEVLTISVTRDRLVENAAFEQLVSAVRTAIDYYALLQAQRVVEEQLASPKPLPSRTAQDLEAVIAAHASELPEPVRHDLVTGIESLKRSIQEREREIEGRFGLLGALATAGIGAMAFEHEAAKQYEQLKAIARELATGALTPGAQQKLSTRVEQWIERARATRMLFTGLSSAENREQRHRFRLKPFLEGLIGQLKPLSRGVEFAIDDSVEGLRLPMGTHAEWNAVFQNIIINAVNAMLDSPERLLRITASKVDARSEIRIEDTGVGVGIDKSDDLFKPFVRRLEISPERQQLGMGGTGLGLSIVKMIADTKSVHVGFDRPSSGFKTCFVLRWDEEK